MEQILLQTVEMLTNVLKSKKVLLVCGRSFDQLPISKAIRNLNVIRFSDFSPNPVYEDICKGVDLFRTSGCDAILAAGGGSAMDTAKCIKLFSRMNPAQNYLTQAYTDTGIPLAAIPTTAGTGSESTRHAVIYYQGEKQSVSHTSIIPNYICLLPEVLENLPLYQKKCTMLDALCQALESWWSIHSTEESINCSCMAVEMIRDHWQSYMEGNPAAAEQILLASNYSGRAINITATTAPHAMSYKLTGLYGLPHGHAVAVCLPEVWQYMLDHIKDCTDSRGRDHLASVLDSFPININWFRDLLASLEISNPISENRSHDIEVLTDSVNPLRLKNTPVLLEKAALRHLYERIVK